MSRDQYLRSRVHPVEVGEQTFHVRPLTGAQLESILSLDGGESLEGVRASCLVCCFCACDESGARIFKDEDLPTISEQVEFSIVRAVAEAAMKVSGLGDDEPGKD